MTSPHTPSPSVTVCILTWNQAGYIRQAIESVVSQVVNASIEVLVGDDFSTDGTDTAVRALEQEYPGLVRLVRHERQLGASENYKRLLELAKGEFIAHLDGDDYWLPGKLQRQLDLLRAQPECIAAYTNALVEDAHGNRIGFFSDVETTYFDLHFLLQHGNFLNTSSMLFRSKAKALLLEINEPFIDYRIHLRLAREGNLALIGDAFAVYRLNTATSMLANDNPAVRLMYWQAILDVPRNLISDTVFTRALANFSCQVVYRAVRSRNLALTAQWWPEIKQATPYGTVRTQLFILFEGFRVALKRALGLINTGGGGPRPRVIFQR